MKPKKFKAFLKKVIEPIIVPIVPVHGSHSEKKKAKSKLKENYDDDLYLGMKKSEMEKHHLDKTTQEYHDLHGMSREEYESLNEGYKPRKDELDKKHSVGEYMFHPDKRVSYELYEYTGSSHRLNRNLVRKALNSSGNDTSFLHSHKKYKELLHSHKKYKELLGDSETIYANDPKLYGSVRSQLITKIKRLDHAFKKSKLKHDATVMTGLGFNPDAYASMHPERHIQFPAYTSSSSSAVTATSFAKGNEKFHSNEGERDVMHSHVLRIHLPKGHPAVPILNHSSLPGENETILPRNMKLKIAEAPYHVHEYDPGKYSNKSVVHYWDAHPVE